MGREIRRVPPNWEHPKDEDGNYLSMHDEVFDDALNEWLTDYNLWKEGKHPDQLKYPDDCKGRDYCEWDCNPPSYECYRPRFTEEPTWYQVYQTVSEGYPVTPPFATKEELVNYLVENGDFWDQKRGDGGWNRTAAERFVESGWALSFVLLGGKLMTSKDCLSDDVFDSSSQDGASEAVKG